MSSKLREYSFAVLVLFLLWHLGALFLDKPFFPAPGIVIVDFVYLIFSGKLQQHFFISTYRVLISLVISFLLAVPLGLFLGQNPSYDRYFAPIIYVLYPLPKTVFLPIIVVFLGLGDLPKIVLISLIIFFQILVTARDAAKNIPYQNILAMKSLNATTWQMYYHLVWPFCLPKILTSLRISLGTAIAVLFLAETFASTDGLGHYILDAMERREYASMYAGIMAIGLLGIIAYAAVDRLENVLCKWNRL